MVATRETSNRVETLRGDALGRGVEHLAARLRAFVLEQHPFALGLVEAALTGTPPPAAATPVEIEGWAQRLDRALAAMSGPDLAGLPEPTPMVGAEARWTQAQDALRAAVGGHLAREAIAASISPDEKRWMLEGIVLTRAVDNRMKQLFLSGEMKYGPLGFQGKGFRSLGQEAIYAGALRLRRGPAYESDHGWTGDVVAPLIRDLGMGLAFHPDVSLFLNAQVGKSGPPLDGKDLHYGDLDHGVLPAAAPLSIATCTVTGAGLAMKLRGEDRVAVSFIGEGGSSLGEWHEAINLAAARALPMIFCLQNNQTALSTRVHEQSAARVFGEKAAGYGMPHVTLDGTDPVAVAAAFAWAAARARSGAGPALLELVCMRMCGHAHHDDMLYLGGDPALSFELPTAPERGYADADKYAAWAARDPLATFATELIDAGVVTAGAVDDMKRAASERCDAAVAELQSRPWPAPQNAGAGLFSDGPHVAHDFAAVPGFGAGAGELAVESAPAFDPKGATYLDAVGRAVAEVLETDPRAFVLGEDVAAPYGNAFLLLKPAVDAHPERVLNAPIAEGAIIGACVGAALEGMHPIGEMQFNDFVASGFNELVNAAAKFRYRTGRNVPMVLRMPWGGLRRAGPYHSQDTAPWFYRAFGLKIVAPSTPHDARALLHAACRDPDPVLFFEHIGLYRNPRIKQALPDEVPDLPLGKAALRRAGDDVSLIAYGAFVHRALEAADALAQEGIECDVLDLRSLCPLDEDAIAASVKRCGRALLVGEDSKTGSILESLASKLGESLFEHLDGPVRVLGALDTPVPYAPSLEDAFLVSAEQIAQVARNMLAW